MTFRIITIMLLGVLLSCNPKQESKTSTEETVSINLEELEQKGFDIYQNNPGEAIPIFKQLGIEYEKEKNTKKAAITYLNIANIYDEHLNQIDSALIFSGKSFQIWEQENDSMQMANLYKYIGLLQGKKGQFEEAKSSIRKAINIYEEQNFKQGIAVSEINLADTYYREKDYEKSLIYFNQSKAFWLTQNNKDRIYTDNILGIKILSTLGRTEEVNNLIQENKKIEQETDINSFAKNLFNDLMGELGRN